MKLGLALAGGGVKGAAHIGVLKALEEKGIKPTVISGSSSGSIVAAMYAAGYTPEEIKCVFWQYLKEKKNCDCAVCGRKARSLIDVDYRGLAGFLTGALLLRHRDFQGFLKGQKLLRVLEDCFWEKNIYHIQDIKMPLAITALDLNSGNTIYFSKPKTTKNLGDKPFSIYS